MIRIYTTQQKPTKETIEQYINYDPILGTFYNKRFNREYNFNGKRGIIRIGKCGSYTPAVLAWICMTNSIPNGVIDHIDGDFTNNKWVNLQDISFKENTLKSKKVMKSKFNSLQH